MKKIENLFIIESYYNELNMQKIFINDMKKHIDAIASKYIIPGVTSDQAILFLPAEAIFAELNAYHTEIIDYAYKKRVWITSPTTLISTLTTIQIIMKNIERDNILAKAKVAEFDFYKKFGDTYQVQDNGLKLKNLDIEFKRYKERWDKLAHNIDNVSKDVKDIYTTTDKISKRFDSINQVDVNTIEYKE